MDEVGTMFKLRVLLVLVDDEHNLQTLQELNKLAFAHSYTLIFAWSNLECARYIETLKFYEGTCIHTIHTIHICLYTHMLTYTYIVIHSAQYIRYKQASKHR